MIKIYSITLILLSIFLFSCTEEEEQIILPESAEVDLPIEVKEIAHIDSLTEFIIDWDDEEYFEYEIEEEEEIEEEIPSKRIKASVEKATDKTEDFNQRRYKISQETIDSLNQIIPLFDENNYNQLALSYFTTMSKELCGRAFFAENADSVITRVMEILTTRLNEGTDIVLLIDKTGSMSDDIENVKSGLSQIKEFLSSFDNVNLAMATYGDINYHDELWYSRSDLSSDLDQIDDFIESYSIIGNADTPESVNDAIVKTVREINWTPGNQRLMLVMGDAPSQLPPLSDYSNKEVIAYCDSMEVQFNLYPIIINGTPLGTPDKEVLRNIATIYPNPAVNQLNIKINNPDYYTYNIYDMGGKQVFSNYGYIGSELPINISDLNNGNYLIQIHDNQMMKYHTEQFIVQH